MNKVIPIPEGAKHSKMFEAITRDIRAAGNPETFSPTAQTRALVYPELARLLIADNPARFNNAIKDAAQELSISEIIATLVWHAIMYQAAAYHAENIGALLRTWNDEKNYLNNQN